MHRAYQLVFEVFMVRTRHLLHRTKLSAFRKYCEGLGYVAESTKGVWEALRLRGPGGLAIICDRSGGDHYTTWDLSAKLVNRFLKEGGEKAEEKVMGISEYTTPPPLPEPKIKITTFHGYPVEDYSKEELIKVLGLMVDVAPEVARNLKR